MTPKQAAAKAGVSLSLVYAWLHSGRLPHYRFGRPGKRGTIRIDQTEFELFLQTMKVSEIRVDDDDLRFLK